MELQDFLWTCPYRAYLGIECFGCGAQTALLLLFNGEFTKSFETYPALPTLLILLGVVLASVLTKKRRIKKLILPLIVLNIVIIILSYYLF